VSRSLRSSDMFVFRATETSHRVSNPEFLESGLHSYNIIFETNSSDFGAVLLSCLSSELQETSSLGLMLRIFFVVLNFPKYLSACQILAQIGVSILEL
jgi:hypothetical protein